MSFQPAEDRQLILLVGNAESRLERDARAKLAQQLGTEGMDRSAMNELHLCTELPETGGDLVRRLVGEGEDADSIGGDSKVLDEESNALDEAECLSRTGSGEDEDRP